MSTAADDPSPARALPRPRAVRPTRLDEIARRCGAGPSGGGPSGATTVTGVALSSGLVRPGDLFAAAPGRSGHGARFAADAVRAGAVAVLTDPVGRALVPAGVPTLLVDDVRAVVGGVAAAVYGEPSTELDVLGITGTSGKTTTSYLVRAGLRAAGVESGLIGTVATLVGDDVLDPGLTTPEAPQMQALLAVMRERGVRAVTMEVSSHALAMGRVEGIEFAVAGFTNLSQDHLDFHADMDDYFAAKARLFDGRARRPVVVIDDAWGRRMAEVAGTGAATVSTTGADATWRAVEVRDAAEGATSFRVLGPGGVDRLTRCAIPGRYNVANALLALAILADAGVAPEVAAPAIATASVPGRMERIDAGQPFLAIVDYSHKPAAVAGALAAVRPLTAGRLIVVLGCGGDRDRAKRPLMGAIAARDADVLVVTDDNPRSEDPGAIRRAMLDGAVEVPAGSRAEVVEIGDRRAAIAYAVAAAGPGDTVLVAGKGHEPGQEVAGTVHPFDDRDVLRRALAVRP